MDKYSSNNNANVEHFKKTPSDAEEQISPELPADVNDIGKLIRGAGLNSPGLSPAKDFANEANNESGKKDAPLFDKSALNVESEEPDDDYSIDGPSASYLVVFSEDEDVQAELYDKSIQFIADIDIDSDEGRQLLNSAEEITDEDKAIFDVITEDFTPEQQQQVKVYKLKEEFINERDAEIESAMLDGDDALYGYDEDDQADTNDEDHWRS